MPAMSAIDRAICHDETPPFAIRTVITIGAVGGKSDPSTAIVLSGDSAAPNERR